MALIFGTIDKLARGEVLRYTVQCFFDSGSTRLCLDIYKPDSPIDVHTWLPDLVFALAPLKIVTEAHSESPLPWFLSMGQMTPRSPAIT